MNPTYEDVSTDYELWSQYVDPDATMTEEEFDNLTVDEKIKIQVECFGKEDNKNAG